MVQQKLLRTLCFVHVVAHRLCAAQFSQQFCRLCGETLVQYVFAVIFVLSAGGIMHALWALHDDHDGKWHTQRNVCCVQAALQP